MKTVLVTGASRGLGRAIATEFADKGWRVIATERREAGTAHGSIERMMLDMSSEGSIAELARQLITSNVSVDLLINNAGMNPKDSPDRDYFQSTFKIDQFSPSAIAESLFINALMPFRLISALLPVLADDAAVLNISSWLGSITTKANPGHYGYAGSKALLNMFTKGLALEWQENARSCVALNPGWMQTDMGGQNAKTTPQEVARAILSLYQDGKLHGENGSFLNTDGSLHPW